MNSLESGIENQSRRRFLQGAAGLTLAFCLPTIAKAATLSGGAAAASPFAPNAFLRIGTDNTVTVISKHLEMGQGTYTGLATIVAEELDAAWSTKLGEASASVKPDSSESPETSREDEAAHPRMPDDGPSTPEAKLNGREDSEPHETRGQGTPNVITLANRIRALQRGVRG